jgi:hypothetical protein
MMPFKGNLWKYCSVGRFNVVQLYCTVNANESTNTFLKNLSLYRYSNLKQLKGQSHEKVGEIRVWGGSLGPN